MFDVVGERIQIAKVPSTPGDYAEGVLVALEHVLDTFESIQMFVHGTTAPINAFLERKGVPTALITTRGFGDVYKMARGNRLRMYDLHYRYPEPLVPRMHIIEIDERIDARGNVLEPLQDEQLSLVVERLRKWGVRAVAVCLLHSYLNAEHEQKVDRFLRTEAPDLFVTPSHQVCREWREYERTSTVTLNGYVSPILQSYLRKLTEDLRARNYHK